MFVRVCVLFLALCCISVKAGFPPEECKGCEIKYLKDVNPPEIMGVWYVVLHTDNLPTPSNSDCLQIVFGRRCDMQSNMRMDVAAQVEGEVTLAMRTSIKASSKAPLKVTIGTNIKMCAVIQGLLIYNESITFQHLLSTAGCMETIKVENVFPDKMMITSFQREAGCMAIWTCKYYESTCQKAAWVLCKSLDAEKNVIEKLTKDVHEKSKIPLSGLFSAPIEKCNV